MACSAAAVAGNADLSGESADDGNRGRDEARQGAASSGDAAGRFKKNSRADHSNFFFMEMRKPLLAALDWRVAPESLGAAGGVGDTYHVGPGEANVHLKGEINWEGHFKPVYGRDCENSCSIVSGRSGVISAGNHHDAVGEWRGRFRHPEWWRCWRKVANWASWEGRREKRSARSFCARGDGEETQAFAGLKTEWGPRSITYELRAQRWLTSIRTARARLLRRGRLHIRWKKFSKTMLARRRFRSGKTAAFGFEKTQPFARIATCKSPRLSRKRYVATPANLRIPRSVSG